MSWRLVCFIWGAVALAGFIAMILRGGIPHLEWGTAMRPMPTNHLIRLGDLDHPREPRFIGMYLRLNVLKGEIVTANDVSVAPLLPADSRPWFAISTGDDVSRGLGLDPRSAGQICDQATTVAQGEVVVLFCGGNSERQSCTILTRVAKEDAAKQQFSF